MWFRFHLVWFRFHLVWFGTNDTLRNVMYCTYGTTHETDEIIQAGLPPPSINQIELTPFNQHLDIVQWAKKYGMVLACGAWSKLSSGKFPILDFGFWILDFGYV